MMKALLLATAASLLIFAPAIAQEGAGRNNDSTRTAEQEKTRPGEVRLGLRGNDPCALTEGREVPGREDLTVDRGRFRYRFENEASRTRFNAEPERYEIQWDGADARMGTLRRQGDPERYAIHDRRIYIFETDEGRRAFQAEPRRFVPDAVRDEFSTDAERLRRGREILDRAARSAGLETRRDPCTHMEEETRTETRTTRREITYTRQGWLRYRLSLDEPESRNALPDRTWVLSRDAFVVEDGRSYPIVSNATREDLRRRLHREPNYLLTRRNDEGFRCSFRGPIVIDDTEMDEIDIDFEGLRTRLHIDRESGRVRGIAWRGRIDDGLTRDVTERFTSYRDDDGVLTPNERRVFIDRGETTSECHRWTAQRLLAFVPERSFARETALERVPDSSVSEASYRR